MSIKVAQNMISLDKGMMLTPLQKLPSNVGNLGKIIVATGFEWLPKVQKTAQSGHTEGRLPGSFSTCCQVCAWKIRLNDFFSNAFSINLRDFCRSITNILAFPSFQAF